MENECVKVLEYKGFKDEKEALEWYERKKKEMEEFWKRFENTMIEFKAEMDELFNDFLPR